MQNANPLLLLLNFSTSCFLPSVCSILSKIRILGQTEDSTNVFRTLQLYKGLWLTSSLPNMHSEPGCIIRTWFPTPQILSIACISMCLSFFRLTAATSSSALGLQYWLSIHGRSLQGSAARLHSENPLFLAVRSAAILSCGLP